MIRRNVTPGNAWILVGLVAVLSGALAGCQKVSGSGPGPIPSPSSSSSPTASPAPCGAQDFGNPNLVVVDMGGSLNAVSIAPFGTIQGYAVDPASGFLPDQAALITTTAGGLPITSINTIQFTNIENSYTINHSAVGFPNPVFPPRPYAFPSPVASPLNTIIGSGAWSTGRVQPDGVTGNQCYSQEFTLRPGTYYFGDIDYYNITPTRDVLVVGTPTPSLLHPHSHEATRSSVPPRR